jgi:hypothetical protein
MSKTKRIAAAALIACLSGSENRQSEYGEQNTNQRTRDGEPKRNVPARVLDHASSISILIMCCRLHGTEPPPKASSIVRNRTVGPQHRIRTVHVTDQQTSQMLAHGRLRELIPDPRLIAAAAANPSATLMKELRVENQNDVFMLLISSVRRSAFQKD